MPTAHAILAPSASKRWLECTPSARAEMTCPQRDTLYTQEGTIAHACAETLLNFYLSVGQPMEFEEIRKNPAVFGPFREQMDNLAACSHELALDFWEMVETVHDYYVVPVFEDFLAAKAVDPEAQLLIEAELNLAAFVPESFGSSDAVIIYDDTLSVYDLKYGKGVKVEAKDNTQMLCYALGAAFGPGELYSTDRITMTILQPRLQHISTWEIAYGDLLYWALHILKPKAEMAFRGEGEYKPGDHCKFCRFAPKCRACAMRAKVVAETYAMPEMLTGEEMAEALQMVDSIKTWAARLEEYATSTLLESPEAIPGWKVVEGRSIRKFSSQEGAIAALHENGFSDEVILKPRELKTITDLQKILKGKAFDAILGDFIVRPQGKPTLAPESDRRPAMTDAAADFKDTII